MILQDLLKNRIVLYLVLFLAIINITGFLYVENYQAIMLFVAISYLSTFFSKNMIINLLVPLLVTNLFFANKTISEGMKSASNNNKKNKSQEKTKEKMVNKKTETKKGFTNKKLTPAPATEDEEDEVKGNGKHIDYSATLEQAYDNLQNILGDGGMQNLTKDTKDLIQQQKSLMKTMESMAPILKNANNILGGLDMSKMNNAMGSLTSLMGKVGLTNEK
jgi:hypothetical protein